MRKFFLVVAFFTSHVSLFAYSDTSAFKNEQISLKKWLESTHLHFHHRSFFMSTVNQGSLRDDYALASGAGLGLKTQNLYGFQLGISGFFIYNIFSSNLADLDPVTKQPNRYEIGLFDIENPTNKNDLDRLEELYIKYSISKSSLTVGKINLNTPFINPQDGRMRPTLEEGVWLEINEDKRLGFNGGYIWEISPRSTVKWFSVQHSLGVYPMGVNVNGKRSDYYMNIHSNGIWMGNLFLTPNNRFRVDFWNLFFDNVLNTSLVELRLNKELTAHKVYSGIQYYHQQAVNYGGNQNPNKTYAQKGEQSNAISAQIGVKKSKFNSNLNYTHITGDGRFLMPREWGKDHFYTFLPRERNEGLGNLHAFVIRGIYEPSKWLKAGLAYGYFNTPSVTNYRLNKYGLPSYHQINTDLAYAFNGFLNGMELRLLTVYKIKATNQDIPLRFIYNRVNMINFNLILDFKI